MITKFNIEELDEPIILLDDLDDALIGIGYRLGPPLAAIYDEQKCIEILMNQGMTYEEALEYFDFNVSSAYLGVRRRILLIQNVMVLEAGYLTVPLA